jgi:hypothetical protein
MSAKISLQREKRRKRKKNERRIERVKYKKRGKYIHYPLKRGN